MNRQKSPRLAISITGDLRRRVNRIAHAQGLKHEIATRARIVNEVRRLADDDTVDDPVAAINAYLKELEGA